MRLRLQLSNLNKHKFTHDFSDTINPLSVCETEIETTDNFFLRCHFLSTQRLELFENPKKVDSNFFNLNEKDQVSTLFYGSQTNNSKCANQNILKFIIAYIKTTNCFDRSLISNR